VAAITVVYAAIAAILAFALEVRHRVDSDPRPCSHKHFTGQGSHAVHCWWRATRLQRSTRSLLRHPRFERVSPARQLLPIHPCCPAPFAQIARSLRSTGRNLDLRI